MGTLMEKRDALLKEARGLAEKAKAEGRDLTDDEIQDINAKGAEIQGLNDRIKNAKGAEDLLASLGSPVTDQERGEAAGQVAKSLGEHFLKHAGNLVQNAKGQSSSGRRFQADTPDFKAFGVKAPGDPHTVGSTGAGWLQPEIDRNIVHQYVQRPTIADWLGAGTLTSTSIQYFVERAFDPATGGNFAIVGENAKKPGLTFPAYDPVTETLRKIAGWIKISMEMAEDTDFLVSEINNRLLFQLLVFEEAQILSGDGVGQNVLGLLNRSGLQTEVAADNTDNLDAIFRARTKVQTATGLQIDGLVINPTDYQTLRLLKDGNGQYFGGGPFAGQYGVGGVPVDPPLWGISNTIVTTAVPAGTVLLGAGKQAATVYRKGGIRVEASNVDGEDFTHNRFTVLAEERLTLAVRQPSAFVEVTLSAANPV